MKPPDYRVSTNPKRMCSNCGAFKASSSDGGEYAGKGHCSMYDVTVGAKMVCDKWYAKGSTPPKP